MIDAYNITPRQIADLRNEAHEAGDDVMVKWCDIALASFHLTDASGNRLHNPTTGRRVTRDQARAVCADAINAATAAAAD
jgi:hypothetical protein